MARGYANLRLEWNTGQSTLIKNLGFGKGLNKDAAQIIYRYSYKYIPFSLQQSMGSLANRVRITATQDQGYITHLVKYGKRQYFADEGNPYGDDVKVHRTRAIHELATSHWADWAYLIHKKQIVAEVDKERLKYRKPTTSKRSK